MDEAFFRLKCAGVTVDQIQNKILQAPVMPGFLDCVRYLEERCEASQESVDVAIVSDANTLFIEWILASHSIQFCQIFSNPATLLNDRLHVSYYHQNSQCARCTKNMCKGSILKAILLHGVSSCQCNQGVPTAAKLEELECKYDRVVYVGDGRGDFCPAIHLRNNDTVIARQSHPLHQLLIANENELQAHMTTWKTGHDVLEVLKQKLSG